MQVESSLQMEQRWVQSISDLTYQEDGDSHIDRLNHFWIRKCVGHKSSKHFWGKAFQDNGDYRIISTMGFNIRGERGVVIWVPCCSNILSIVEF